MRKILLITSFFIGGILLAQNNNFANNYSTSDLEKIQKTIPKNQKQEFYKQYLRAKIFEDMKSKFIHKKYSAIVLKKFTDSVIAGNTSNETPDNTDNKAFVPHESYEQFIARHQKYISQNEDMVKKEFNETLGKLNAKNKQEQEKQIAELVNIRMAQIQDASRKTSEMLKSEYNIQIYNEKENFENDPSTILGKEKIIKKIDDDFAKNLQHSEDNYILLAQNIGLFPGQRFPDVTSEPQHSAIYETVPGEILTYVTENGVIQGRYYLSYKIYGDEIMGIPVLSAMENENFVKKVSKYIKGNWRYEDRTGYEIEKMKNGEYLISTSIYKEDDDDACCPSMAIEYKTKDFKNFVPLRISKEENKWIKIK